jgi:hypothetical protein
MPAANGARVSGRLQALTSTYISMR